MNDFDALLTRSFAEAHEPVDDGFSVRVAHVVARRERTGQVRTVVYAFAMAGAGAAVAAGLLAIGNVFAPTVIDNAGLQLAHAQSALATTSSFGAYVQGLWQSMGAGMTQFLLVAAAATAGALTLRNTQVD